MLLIGFPRPYDCLPTEGELLRAIADRSALAIDRAGMNDALREREIQIAELSGHLLYAQEEERKRISRELTWPILFRLTYRTRVLDDRRFVSDSRQATYAVCILYVAVHDVSHLV